MTSAIIHRPRKLAAARQARQPVISVSRPRQIAKPHLDVRAPVDMLTFYTEDAEKFMALPIKERERVMLEIQSEMKHALGDTTLEDCLTERRREAGRDA